MFRCAGFSTSARLVGITARSTSGAEARGAIRLGSACNLLRQTARRMLIGVLSARIAGKAIGASLRLPNMAPGEFLSCLSRGALETAARAENVNIAPRAKDTWARMVTRFKDGAFVYPSALFRLTP